MAAPEIATSPRPALSGIPRTLLLTLRARAEEHRRQDRLFADPQAAEWFAGVGWDPVLDAWYSGPMQTGISIRTRFFDEAVATFLDRMPEPLVVEVGAGLSTRYHRLGLSGVPYYELDLPPIIDLRRQLGEPVAPGRGLLDGSVLGTGWFAELPAHPPESTLLVAEGLLVYFHPAEVRQILALWRRQFPGATLLLDTFNWFGQWLNARATRRIGAPIQWTIDRLEQLRSFGLEPLAERRMFAHHRRRWGLLAAGSWIPLCQKADRFVITRLLPLG